MGTIPEELKNFKSKVSPSIGSMSSTVSVLSSKISSIMSGNTEAMIRTGNMLENGIGVKQSLKKAYTYYKRAYKLGDLQASAKLESIKMKMTTHVFH